MIMDEFVDSIQDKSSPKHEPRCQSDVPDKTVDDILLMYISNDNKQNFIFSR